MSKKKRNRQSIVSPSKGYERIYPQKQEKKPIDKKAFMKIIKIVQKWLIDRCKGATNSMVEDAIKWLIEFILLYIWLKLL